MRHLNKVRKGILYFVGLVIVFIIPHISTHDVDSKTLKSITNIPRASADMPEPPPSDDGANDCGNPDSGDTDGSGY